MKKRIAFLDFMKGTAAMMVVLAHLDNIPKEYLSFISFIMLPAFFFTPGYVTKIPTKNICKDFLYKRAGKLVVLYAIYMIILPFSSVSLLKSFLKEPVLIVQKLTSIPIAILSGKEFWFVPCLVVIFVLFAFIAFVSKGNHKIMALISLVLGTVGLVISDKKILYWSFDTALVCQMVFMAGFFAKEYNLMEKIEHKKVTCVCIGAAYMLIWGIGSYFSGFDAMYVDIVLNNWGVWYFTIPAIITGVVAVALIGEIIGGSKLVNYIGSHSLIYFAFASHGASVVDKIIAKLAGVTGISLLSNSYFVTLVDCVLGCLLMVIPCLIIDKYFSFLNGNFQMPFLGKKNKA